MALTHKLISFLEQSPHLIALGKDLALAVGALKGHVAVEEYGVDLLRHVKVTD